MSYIEIKLDKAVLFLTKKEITTLLACKPDIWREGIKRGKYFKRSEKQRTRESEKFQRDSINKDYLERIDGPE